MHPSRKNIDYYRLIQNIKIKPHHLDTQCWPYQSNIRLNCNERKKDDVSIIYRSMVLGDY